MGWEKALAAGNAAVESPRQQRLRNVLCGMCPLPEKEAPTAGQVTAGLRFPGAKSCCTRQARPTGGLLAGNHGLITPARPGPVPAPASMARAGSS